MADFAQLLRRKEFWFYYHFAEDQPLDPELAGPYAIQAPGSEFKHIFFPMKCGGSHVVQVSVGIEFWSLQLDLLVVQENVSHQMGWWDEARAHPFALHPAEAELLLAHWDQNPANSIGPQWSLLLLSRWMGIPKQEGKSIQAWKERISEAYLATDATPGEVATLTDASLPCPTEDDYRWTEDPKLGRVFGGEYPCYSLRNAAHAGGEEGTFPFTRVQQLVKELESSTR